VSRALEIRLSETNGRRARRIINFWRNARFQLTNGTTSVSASAALHTGSTLSDAFLTDYWRTGYRR